MTMHLHYIKEIVRPINGQVGDLLKVSDFIKYDMVDGTMKNGSAAFEKRGLLRHSTLNGPQRTVYSVISVHTFVLMLVSVHSFWMRQRRLALMSQHLISLLQSNSRVCNSASKYQFLTVQVVATVLMSAQVRRVTRHCQ